MTTGEPLKAMDTCFGIEQEHFLFRDGRCPSIEDITTSFEALLQRGFDPLASNAHGQLLSVALKTAFGNVVLKNDFCTHILEAAFPPLRSAAHFRELYNEVKEHLRVVLTSRGLRIHYGAVLPAVPPGTILRHSDQDHEGERMERLLTRALPTSPLADPRFHAAICATQIHLPILGDHFFAILPSLYRLEYLFPLLFGNGSLFRDRRSYCIRPLIYRDNFTAQYQACGFPVLPIPSSATQYEVRINSSVPFIRDYSFIAPRTNRRVEFRIGCSQDSCENILSMVSLRLATYLIAKNAQPSPTDTMRAQFYEICETGQCDAAMFANDRHLIQNILGALPADFQPHLSSVIERMAALEKV